MKHVHVYTIDQVDATEALRSLDLRTNVYHGDQLVVTAGHVDDLGDVIEALTAFGHRVTVSASEVFKNFKIQVHPATE